MCALGNGVNQIHHPTDFLGTFTQALDALFRLPDGIAGAGDTIDRAFHGFQGLARGVDGLAGRLVARLGQARDAVHIFGSGGQFGRSPLDLLAFLIGHGEDGIGLRLHFVRSGSNILGKLRDIRQHLRGFGSQQI